MTVEELIKIPVRLWDVSKVKDMSYMFLDATSFDQDVSNWDVSNVKNMNGMFKYTTSFNHYVCDWDISSVIDMGEMFKDAKALDQDLEAWGPRLHPDVYVNDMFVGSPLEGNEPSWYHERVGPLMFKHLNALL